MRMAKKKAKKLVKRTNVATLSINARKTTAAYDQSALGARGWDGKQALVDSQTIVLDPVRTRKKGTYISR